MSFEIENKLQPEEVRWGAGSINDFLDEENDGWHRNAVTPNNMDSAVNTSDYIECEQPREYDEKIGPLMMQRAVKTDIDNDVKVGNVTAYRIVAFGDPEQPGLSVVVKYTDEIDIQTEVQERSETTYSSQI